MGPFIRIALRALGWFLIGKGYATEHDVNIIVGDPELMAGLEVAIGAGCASVAELWYWLARRLGWSR